MASQAVFPTTTKKSNTIKLPVTYYEKFYIQVIFLRTTVPNKFILQSRLEHIQI